MAERTRRRISPRLVVGLAVLILGLVLVLDNLDVVEAGYFLDYWPLVLVLIGLAKLTEAPRTQALIWAFFWIFVGGWQTAYNFDFVDIDVLQLWPILLIVLGLSLVRRAMAPARAKKPDSAQADSKGVASSTTGFACLSGVRRQFSDKNFKGGDYTAIMGGIEIDLREAGIADGEAVMDVFAFWGGVVIRVPKTFTVDSQVTALLGGFEDHTDSGSADPSQRLVIRGTAIMGGVEVKN